MHSPKMKWLASTSTLVICLAAATVAAYGQKPSGAKPGTVSVMSSTVPQNGDVNPYGVFRIARNAGSLVRGNILVSNFNNGSNLQGTGTTLVQISPTGAFNLFAQIDAKTLPGPCPGGVGLTTALVVLRSGWVIVGSLPTSDGMSPTAQAGCLLVLNSKGKVVETITDPKINGPWDMTVFDQTAKKGMRSRAALFVTNVLNGTVAAGGNVVHEGTILRIVLNVPSEGAPSVESITTIGSDFPERTDPSALVIGPTGLALSKNKKTLFVADSVSNRIAAISDPLVRTSTAKAGATTSIGGHLNDPLGMTLTLNGNILTVNGNDGFLVETTPTGTQASATLLDNTGSPPGGGTLFGVTDVPGLGVVFVDDGSNTLNLFR